MKETSQPGMNRSLIAILLVWWPLLLGAQVKTLDFSCEVSGSEFSRGLKSDVYVVSPDGSKTVVSSQKESKKTIPLTEDGCYKVFCAFETKEYGLDTLSKEVFFCNKEVIGIKVQLKYGKDSGFLLIQRIMEPDPGVELVYSTFFPQGYYRGPFFTITNNSQDTVYGRYLPGYFWGEVARIQDGVCGEFRPGTIDTNFVEKDPLFPGESTDALVGSFGVRLYPGMYRFKLFYQKTPTSFDSASLLYDNGRRKWYCSVHDGYQITCDFEIKESDFSPKMGNN